MRGILLAGGKGTRLSPMTTAVNKHLLPIFDKPMVYYPLSTLMLCDIREIVLVTTKESVPLFKKLLGNGSQFGIRIDYAIQNAPEGLPQAISIASEYLAERPFCLILADNLFYGSKLGNHLKINSEISGAKIFAYQVSEPHKYGVVELNENGEIISLQEKPAIPLSNYAIPGIYFFDKSAINFSKHLKKSSRNEYEILDLLNKYLEQSHLDVEILNRGTTWFDMGTPESMHDAASFVRTVQERQGLMIASPEEIAFRKNWISHRKFMEVVKLNGNNHYTDFLNKISWENNVKRME